MFTRKFMMLLVFTLAALVFAGDRKPSSKADKLRRARAGDFNKIAGFNDRKAGVMDNGRMIMYFTNSGVLGDPAFQRTVQWPSGLQPPQNLIWQIGVMFGAVTAAGDTITDESYPDRDIPTEDIFNPEPGYDNPEYIFPPLNNTTVARSDVLESYPPRFNSQWPSVTNVFDPEELRNLARQESFWIMRDNNDPEYLNQGAVPITPIGVEVKVWLIQLNSSLTRDFVYVYYRLKNISGGDLRNCRFGILVDPDMPALVGAEFEDDDDGFIRDLNLAYARDSDNFYASQPGVNIGYFGVKFLRSPKDQNGNELGLTSWTTFEYGDMPGEGQFLLSEEGPDETLGSYANLNHAQYDYMRPGLYMQPRINTDVVFTMGSGDFNLAGGDSVDMAVAFIAADDFNGLLDKAKAAQTVFDNNFVGPTAPAPPAVTAVPGDENVTLYWDAEPSENSVDALTGRPDFEGYRIYRSDDRGGSWGEATDNVTQYPYGVLPIAEYDVINGVGDLAATVVSHSDQVSQATISSLGLAEGSQPGDAEGVDNSTFFSNDDFRIIFDSDNTFQVLNATQGVFLKYLTDLSGAVGFAVLDTGYVLQTDNPDATHGLYRSDFPIYVTGQYVRITDAEGSAAAKGDVFIVDQRRNEPGSNSGLVHSFTDQNVPGLQKQIVNGYPYWYTVAAYDREDLVLGITLNENPPLSNPSFSGDQTIEAIPQAPVAGFVEPDAPTNAIFDHASGIAHIQGFPLTVIDPRLVRDATYLIRFTETDEEKLWSLFGAIAGGDTAIQENNAFYDGAADNTQMFDGMVLRVQDLPAGINGELSGQTARVDNDTLSLDFDVTAYGDYLYNEGQAEKDYEIRFVADSLSYPGSDSGTVVSAPFALHEINDGGNTQIGAVIYDDGDGVWSIGESFDLINAAYADPTSFSFADEDYVYYLTLAVSDTNGEVSAGNVYRIAGNRRLHEEDVYRFTTQKETITLASEALSAVRVVPNPFVVSSEFDTGSDRHELHFTRIPAKCTIKIFTLAGELVRNIEYDRDASNGLDFAKWDLKNAFGSEVAYGVYLYHLDSGAGKKIGKIAIVR